MRGIFLVIFLTLAVLAAISQAQGGTNRQRNQASRNSDRPPNLPPTSTKKGKRPARLQNFNPREQSLGPGGRITFKRKSGYPGSSGLNAPIYSHPAVLTRPEPSGGSGRPAGKPSIKKQSSNNQRSVGAGRLGHSQAPSSNSFSGSRVAATANAKQGAAVQTQSSSQNAMSQTSQGERSFRSQGSAQGPQVYASAQVAGGKAVAQASALVAGGKAAAQVSQGQNRAQGFQERSEAKKSQSRAGAAIQGTSNAQTVPGKASGGRLQGKPGPESPQGSSSQMSAQSSQGQTGKQSSTGKLQNANRKEPMPTYISFGTNLVGSSTFQTRRRFQTNTASQSGRNPSTQTKSEGGSPNSSSTTRKETRKRPGVPVSQVAGATRSSSGRSTANNGARSGNAFTGAGRGTGSQQARGSNGNSATETGSAGSRKTHRQMPVASSSSSASMSSDTSTNQNTGQTKSSQAGAASSNNAKSQGTQSAAQITGPFSRVSMQRSVSSTGQDVPIASGKSQRGMYRSASSGRVGPFIPPTRTRYVKFGSRISSPGRPSDNAGASSSGTSSSGPGSSFASSNTQGRSSGGSGGSRSQQNQPGGSSQTSASNTNQEYATGASASDQNQGMSSSGKGSNKASNVAKPSGSSAKASASQSSGSAGPTTRTKTGPSPFQRRQQGSAKATKSVEKEPIEREVTGQSGGSRGSASRSSAGTRPAPMAMSHPEILRRPDPKSSSRSTGGAGNSGGSGGARNGGNGNQGSSGSNSGGSANNGGGSGNNGGGSRNNGGGSGNNGGGSRNNGGGSGNNGGGSGNNGGGSAGKGGRGGATSLNKPCSTSPVCASDGFTYLSDCYLRPGLERMCDGYCPCPVPPPPPRPAARPPTRRDPGRYNPPPCNCPWIYDPVCGVNGKTYDNDCQRRCKYVGLECNGECPCYSPGPAPTLPPASCESQCPNVFGPVCTIHGNTYDNDCLRDCSGEPKDCDGECPCHVDYSYSYVDVNNEPSNQPLTTCECAPYDVDPVCTTDGETLWYGCEAICLGKTIACSSSCPC